MKREILRVDKGGRFLTPNAIGRYPIPPLELLKKSCNCSPYQPSGPPDKVVAWHCLQRSSRVLVRLRQVPRPMKINILWQGSCQRMCVPLKGVLFVGVEECMALSRQVFLIRGCQRVLFGEYFGGKPLGLIPEGMCRCCQQVSFSRCFGNGFGPEH